VGRGLKLSFNPRLVGELVEIECIEVIKEDD
jgi:hypothetical protein